MSDSMNVLDAFQNVMDEFGGTFYVRNTQFHGIQLRDHTRMGGYFVADSRYEYVIPVSDFNYGTFKSYVKDYLNAFTFPGQYLGVWYDNPTRKNCLVYLDVSVHFTNIHSAMAFAREHNQIAIWDIANHESIVVSEHYAVV